MKKTAASLFIVLSWLTFTACNQQTGQPESEITTEAVTSGSGNQIGNQSGNQIGNQIGTPEAVKKVLEKKTSEPVCGCFYMDSGEDGHTSAFVFTGTKSYEDTGIRRAGFQGSLWYVSGQTCTLIQDSLEASGFEPERIEPELIEYESEKHLMFQTNNRQLPGSTVTYIWTVRDHNPQLVLETPHSCFMDNGQLAIVKNFYSNSARGRIWQRYYLYWDEAERQYREYGAKAITEEEFLAYGGAREMEVKVEEAIKEEIAGECKKDGIDKIETSYIRQDNGIINVNYAVFCGETVYYRYSILAEEGGQIRSDVIPKHYNMYEWGYMSENRDSQSIDPE